MKHKVTITQSHEFSTKDISDLLITAFEGGINYWCGAVHILRDEDDNDLCKSVPLEHQLKVFRPSDAVAYGGEIILKDIESDDTWILGIEDLKSGIAQYCTEAGIPLADLVDVHDADMSDSIVQYALFKELVFG